MKATFKIGPHMVILEDSEGVQCQDEQILEMVTGFFESNAGGPTVSPTFETVEQMKPYITDLQWIDTEIIH